MLRLGNKGQAGGLGLVAGATLLVVGVVFLLIGIFISSEMIDTINGSVTAGTDAQTTFDSVSGNLWSGFTIAGISLIVIGAVIILGLLRSAF